jgi:hypothetical protein
MIIDRQNCNKLGMSELIAISNFLEVIIDIIGKGNLISVIKKADHKGIIGEAIIEVIKPDHYDEYRTAFCDGCESFSKLLPCKPRTPECQRQKRINNAKYN